MYQNPRFGRSPGQSFENHPDRRAGSRPRRGGRAGARDGGGSIAADKAYDADKRVIEPLEAAQKTSVLQTKKNRKSPGTCDKVLYESCHLIENFFCWAKQFRAIATLYDKTARNYLAAFHMIAVLCWLNCRQALTLAVSAAFSTDHEEAQMSIFRACLGRIPGAYVRSDRKAH